MELTTDAIAEIMNRMDDNDVRILLLCFHYSMTIREISKVMKKEIVEIGNWRDSAIQKLMLESECRDINQLKKLIKNLELDKLSFFSRRNLFGILDI